MNVTNTKATKITPALHFRMRFHRLRGRPGFISFFMILLPEMCAESNWSAIAAQPDRRDDKCYGAYQPKPETRRTEVSHRRELWACDRVPIEGESLRRESH